MRGHHLTFSDCPLVGLSDRDTGVHITKFRNSLASFGQQQPMFTAGSYEPHSSLSPKFRLLDRPRLDSGHNTVRLSLINQPFDGSDHLRIFELARNTER